MLDKAISITAQAFEGKLDKGGTPYILHCLHVMHKVRHLGSDAMQAAVMHDLIEDTDWTLVDLHELGFNERVVTLVERMTHQEGESYDDYLDRIAVGQFSRAIKMADLKHNSDITRMKGLRAKDFERLEKYHRAYDFLARAIN